MRAGTHTRVSSAARQHGHTADEHATTDTHATTHTRD
jgi:hypothetical protein